MIEAAKQALREAGLINGSPAQALITVGRSLNVQVFQGDDFYNVKLSRLELEREYRALCELGETVLVPSPVALVRVNGLNALITRGMRFRCVRGSPPPLWEFMANYHATQMTAPAFAAPAVSHRDAIRAMLERPALEGLRESVAAWLESSASDFLEALPAVRQHGDLVPMNLGIVKDGYVIFDWEDFGVVTLPGLDLAIFLLDTVGFNAAGITRALSGEFARLRECLLSTLRLREPDFPQFLFAALIEYLYLKCSMQYRAPVIEATLSLLRYLARCGLKLNEPGFSQFDDRALTKPGSAKALAPEG